MVHPSALPRGGSEWVRSGRGRAAGARRDSLRESLVVRKKKSTGEVRMAPVIGRPPARAGLGHPRSAGPTACHPGRRPFCLGGAAGAMVPARASWAARSALSSRRRARTSSRTWSGQRYLLLAAGAADQPVDRGDPFLGTVRPLDGLFEDVPQVALCAVTVLREDRHVAVVPAGRRAGGRLADGGRSGQRIVRIQSIRRWVLASGRCRDRTAPRFPHDQPTVKPHRARRGRGWPAGRAQGRGHVVGGAGERRLSRGARAA